MATVEQSESPDAGVTDGVRRRDFIHIAAASWAGVGALAIVIPLVRQMSASADVLALALCAGLFGKDAVSGKGSLQFANDLGLGRTTLLCEYPVSEAALARAGGVVAQAASELGFSRQALYRRMERLGIERK